VPLERPPEFQTPKQSLPQPNSKGDDPAPSPTVFDNGFTDPIPSDEETFFPTPTKIASAEFPPTPFMPDASKIIPPQAHFLPRDQDMLQDYKSDSASSQSQNTSSICYPEARMLPRPSKINTARRRFSATAPLSVHTPYRHIAPKFCKSGAPSPESATFRVHNAEDEGNKASGRASERHKPI
jgi:hypothetical protein